MAPLPFPSASCLRADRGPITAVSHFANTPARFERAQCKSRILHETVLIYFPPLRFSFPSLQIPPDPSPFPGILPFQHPVKGTWKHSVDGCHGPPGCLPTRLANNNTHTRVFPLPAGIYPAAGAAPSPQIMGRYRETSSERTSFTSELTQPVIHLTLGRRVRDAPYYRFACCRRCVPNVRIRRRFVQPGKSVCRAAGEHIQASKCTRLSDTEGAAGPLLVIPPLHPQRPPLPR